jgi:hypothetical protein
LDFACKNSIRLMGREKESPMNLLRTIEKFLQRHDMPPTVFGRSAVNDRRLVFDMRRGREPGERLRKNIEHFMNKYERNSTDAF